MKELREDHRPADLWYWADWFSSFDVRACSLAAQGLWFNMLGIMSRADRKGTLSINGKPMDSKELAKFVGEFKDKVEELLVELEYYQVFSRLADGTIYNRRMYRDGELSRKRAEAGRKGGLKQIDSKSGEEVPSKTEATLEDEDEDEDKSSPKNKRKGVGGAGFDAWWEAYPRKVAKQDAARAYVAAVKAGAAPDDLLKAARGYVAELRRNETEERFVKHPATFLRADRWKDYLDRPAPRDVGQPITPPTTREKEIARQIGGLIKKLWDEARPLLDEARARGTKAFDEAYQKKELEIARRSAELSRKLHAEVKS